MYVGESQILAAQLNTYSGHFPDRNKSIRFCECIRD